MSGVGGRGEGPHRKKEVDEKKPTVREGLGAVGAQGIERLVKPVLECSRRRHRAADAGAQRALCPNRERTIPSVEMTPARVDARNPHYLE